MRSDPVTGGAYIKTAEELAFLANEVNAVRDFDGEYISLEWTPIGDGVDAFRGSFSGNGHTIANLRISRAIGGAELISDSSDRLNNIYIRI